MNAEEFFEVAEALKVSGPPFAEGKQRSAISRYYYAAFHEALSRLPSAVSKYVQKRRNSVHFGVINAYKRGKGNLVLIGQLLESLKKLRESADYDISVTAKSSAVGDAHSTYKNIIGELATADTTQCYDEVKSSGV